MEVQIAGTRKSPDTRKALCFFAGRRIKTLFAIRQYVALFLRGIGLEIQRSSA